VGQGRTKTGLEALGRRPYLVKWITRAINNGDLRTSGYCTLLMQRRLAHILVGFLRDDYFKSATELSTSNDEPPFSACYLP
jgi:hypothetical protein